MCFYITFLTVDDLSVRYTYYSSADEPRDKNTYFDASLVISRVEKSSRRRGSETRRQPQNSHHLRHGG